MLRVNKVPFEQVDPDSAENHAGERRSARWIGMDPGVRPDTRPLYKTFVDFYYTHIMTDAYGISVKLTELVRHKVAQINECHL